MGRKSVAHAHAAPPGGLQPPSPLMLRTPDGALHSTKVKPAGAERIPTEAIERVADYHEGAGIPID
ncbi:MAG: hypothetical protein GDA40_07415 [Rhodobacteraceae bacterium]|nr:hypothetical protein [Paracoccaceae bacterium]